MQRARLQVDKLKALPDLFVKTLLADAFRFAKSTPSESQSSETNQEKVELHYSNGAKFQTEWSQCCIYVLTENLFTSQQSGTGNKDHLCRWTTFSGTFLPWTKRSISISTKMFREVGVIKWAQPLYCQDPWAFFYPAVAGNFNNTKWWILFPVATVKSRD